MRRERKEDHRNIYIYIYRRFVVLRRPSFRPHRWFTAYRIACALALIPFCFAFTNAFTVLGEIARLIKLIGETRVPPRSIRLPNADVPGFRKPLDCPRRHAIGVILAAHVRIPTYSNVIERDSHVSIFHRETGFFIGGTFGFRFGHRIPDDCRER